MSLAQINQRLWVFIVASVSLLGLSAWHLYGLYQPQPTQAAQVAMQCISYSPFYQGSNPTDPRTVIDAQQIEQDLRQLHQQFPCVRTYSVALGLDAVPAIAQQLGMQVYLGVWIGWLDADNQRQIDRAVQLAKQYPNTIKAIIVGNEVLLRGEQKPARLREYLQGIQQQTQIPITYADVWEFWRKNRSLADSVDFVTVHILPYWEDQPVAIEHAVQHVDAVMQLLQREFNKPILIGETGWPSSGRQRFGAQASLRNQARYFQAFLQLAQQRSWQYNVIEAYDQPWKRMLEGTVGGHWGWYDVHGKAKFQLGADLAERQDRFRLPIILVMVLLPAGLLFYRRGWRLSANNGWGGMAWMTLLLLTSVQLFWQIDFLLSHSISFADWMGYGSICVLSSSLMVCCLYSHLRHADHNTFAYHTRWLLILLALAMLISASLLIIDGRYRNFVFPTLLLSLLTLALHQFTRPFPALQAAPQVSLTSTLCRTLCGLLAISALLLLWLEPSNLYSQLSFFSHGLMLALLWSRRPVSLPHPAST